MAKALPRSSTCTSRLYPLKPKRYSSFPFPDHGKEYLLPLLYPQPFKKESRIAQGAAVRTHHYHAAHDNRAYVTAKSGQACCENRHCAVHRIGSMDCIIHSLRKTDSFTPTTCSTPSYYQAPKRMLWLVVSSSFDSILYPRAATLWVSDWYCLMDCITCVATWFRMWYRGTKWCIVIAYNRQKNAGIVWNRVPSTNTRKTSMMHYWSASTTVDSYQGDQSQSNGITQKYSICNILRFYRDASIEHTTVDVNRSWPIHFPLGIRDRMRKW